MKQKITLLALLPIYLMLVSGLFFFWRVLDPRPAPVGAGYGVRVVMASVAMAGSTPLAAYITYKSSVLYPAYDVKGRLWGLEALLDERFGGLIMWIPGGIVFGVLLLIVMQHWGRRVDRLDTLRRHGVESKPVSPNTGNGRLAWGLAVIPLAVFACVIALGYLQWALP